MKFSVSGILAVSVLVFGPSIRGDEQKVPLAQVPRAGIDAVKHKFPQAELKEASKEVEGKKTTYEVSLTSAGKHITVSLDEKGEIEEIETEIAMSDVPRAVTEAIAARYPQAKIKKAEEIVEIEDGKEEEKAYELDVVTAAGKSVEVTVDARGKIKEAAQEKEEAEEKEGK